MFGKQGQVVVCTAGICQKTHTLSLPCKHPGWKELMYAHTIDPYTHTIDTHA